MAKFRSGHHKLVLLGDSGVGKSSLAVQYVKNEFLEHPEPTIGAAFLTKGVELDDYTVKYEIWDTAGQERYRSLAPMYYRGAQAAVVVYDITEPSSFDGAKSWVDEIRRREAGAVVCLAGNKLDKESKRQVATEMAQEYANENSLMFFEVSAKTGASVPHMFLDIAKRLPRKTELPRPPPPSPSSSSSTCGCN